MNMFRILVSVPLITMLLAGCTSSTVTPVTGVDKADVVIHIPKGAFDEASGGPWYVWDGPAEAPATIRFVNDDLVWHRILVLPPEAQTAPVWASDDGHDHEGHDHDHGGHDHGTEGHDHSHGAAPPLADFGINASEEVLIHIDEPGLFMLHCHPHPWMEATLDVQGPDQSFQVTQEPVTRELWTDGTTNEGESSEVPVEVNGPNLVRFAATVRWDDRVDDTPPLTGETTNAPDTLRVELVAPDGSVVASNQSTQRVGSLEVVFDSDLDWPDTVQAPSASHAVAVLSEQVPDDMTGTGTWRLVVHVVAAPGVVPNDPGGEPEGMDDGVQAWSATIVTQQAWAKITA